VPQVLASAWNVDSHATSELIRGFYRGIQLGLEPEAALSDSAAAVRRQDIFAHPYYWAAFEFFRS